MEDNKELEEQMKMLEGMDLGEGFSTPFTPENPTNLGVVTNNVTPNQQAQAQVVQQTTTTSPLSTIRLPLSIIRQPTSM